jgi:hypothetical protein
MADFIVLAMIDSFNSFALNSALISLRIAVTETKAKRITKKCEGASRQFVPGSPLARLIRSTGEED